MNPDLQAKLKTLPAGPGVYFHKDAGGEVIYVGKAAVLKNRVRQYFNNSPKDVKTSKLVANIVMTDWIETDSEIDALFLENEMIKRYKPKFNILLRDDKNNIFVRIDFKSDWPTVTTTRSPLDDGAEYIGPFYGGAAIKKALRYLRKSFPYLAKQSEKQSALLGQLGLTPGNDSKQYHQDLRNLAHYLKGGRIQIQKSLERDMKQAAANLDYERARQLRDKLFNLNELRKQIIFGREEFMDIAKDQALMGAKELFALPDLPRRIETYDISHHGGQDVVGSMVVATNGVADKREYRKFKINRGKNDDFGSMREIMTRRFSPRHTNWGWPDLIIVDGGAPQLAAICDLVHNTPLVGLAKENDELIVLKDRSHLDTTRIEQLLYSKIDGVLITDCGSYYAINLHEGAQHSAGHSFTMTGSTTINPYTDLLKLAQRLRDESHRFAITYHQSVKQKRQLTSWLDDIPGVGPATRKKLLRHFGSISKIRLASQSEIAKIVGDKLAATICARQPQQKEDIK